MLRKAKLEITSWLLSHHTATRVKVSASSLKFGCWMNPHLNKIICLLNLQRWKVELNNNAKANFYFGNKTAYVHLIQ